MINLNKTNQISSAVHLFSLIGVVIGLIISSFNVSVICLIVFCLSGNISVSSGIQAKVERLSIIDQLLRDGVFDDAIDIPEEAVERLKLDLVK
jgi:hypothetical protein